MSWLPIEKLTKEEKDILQDFNKKKTTLHGKYHQQIKYLDTSHETWIGNFSSQHKKKLQKCQELYKVDQHKIDKTEYSTDELQAYAIYKLAVDTYKNTKEQVTEKYTKDHEVLNLELDKISKEINKNLQEREAEADETRREEQLLKHKEEIKGIVYDIKRVDKAIVIGTVYRNSLSSTNNYICLSRPSPEDPTDLKSRSVHVLHGPMHA